MSALSTILTTRAAALAAAALSLVALPGAAEARCIDESGEPCPPPSGEQVHHVGTFNGAGSTFLQVHAAPNAGAKVIRRVRSGRRALIVCQIRGGVDSGPYGRGRLWDKLLHGGYISDTKVHTGSDGRVAPNCEGPRPAPSYGNDAFRYDDPGRWIGPEGCSGGHTRGALALKGWLQRRYRFTQSIGGYACRQNTADPSRTSLHGEGRALDWMVSADAGHRRAVARFIRRVSARNWRLGRAMGIQELIWNQRIWTASRHGEGWRAYTGPNPHTDHIHIGLNRPGASKRTSYWR